MNKPLDAIPDQGDDTPLDELLDTERDDEKTVEQIEQEAREEAELEGQAPAPTPEPAPAAPAAAKPEDEDNKRVPLAEVIAERRKRQEAERRAQELEERLQTRERLEKLEGGKPPAAPADNDPEPDYLDDPKAWTEWKIRQSTKDVAGIKETVGKTVEQQQQERQFNEFMGTIQRSEAAFVAQQPDYHQALAHIRQQRVEELKLFAPEGVTDEQILQQLTREELATAAQLLRAGRNPAQVAYEYAKRRGYTPPAAAPAGNGQPPAPAGIGSTPADDAVKNALRGLPPGGSAPLPASNDGSTVPPEFDAAFSERFGKRM